MGLGTRINKPDPDRTGLSLGDAVHAAIASTMLECRATCRDRHLRVSGHWRRLNGTWRRPGRRLQYNFQGRPRRAAGGGGSATGRGGPNSRLLRLSSAAPSPISRKSPRRLGDSHGGPARSRRRPCLQIQLPAGAQFSRESAPAGSDSDRDRGPESESPAPPPWAARVLARRGP